MTLIGCGPVASKPEPGFGKAEQAVKKTMNMDNSKNKTVTVTRDSDTLGPAGESRCTSHRSSSTSKFTHQKCEVAAPQQNHRAFRQSTTRRNTVAPVHNTVHIDNAKNYHDNNNNNNNNNNKSLSNTDKLNRRPQQKGFIKNSFTTETILECVYKPQYTDFHKGLKMLCTRVNVNNRNSNLRSNPRSSSSVLDLYSHPEKSNTNEILGRIGLVVNDGTSLDELKMYTFESKPSKTTYFKRHVAGFSAIRNVRTCSSADNTERNAPSTNNHESYNTKEYRNYTKTIDKMIEEITGANPSTKSRRQVTQTDLKYWSKRHKLFSKFDDGILLDDESFYSVCPEALSRHIAKRCANKVVVDPFCGAGGNIIQLAFTCKKVIAVDIDPVKIAFAKRNADIYGVSHKIEFIVGDVFRLAPTLKADVVFMSPPWGGPDYSAHGCFTLESMCSDHHGGGFAIFALVKQIAPNVAFHIPKTTNIRECLWLARSFGHVEIQQNIIDHRLDSITAFYGDGFVTYDD